MNAQPEEDPRICDYCGGPTEGMLARLVPGDHQSPRVAFGPDHQTCRMVHHATLDRMEAARRHPLNP